MEIVKVCKIHGNLNRDQCDEDKRKDGLTFSFKCKKCKHEWYLKNIEKRREYSRNYEKTKRNRNKDKHAEYQRNYSREWRRKNSEKVNIRVKEARLVDPERFREYDRKRRASNIEKAREMDVIKKHKISYDEYKWMCDSQDGKCAICNKEETRKSRTDGKICRLTIDHNHTTGKIRQLLCHNCNVFIGHSKESIEFLNKAIDYLKKHNHVE